MKKTVFTLLLVFSLLFIPAESCQAEGISTEVAEANTETAAQNEEIQQAAIDLQDGTYMADVTLEGGSGRASISSPAEVIVSDQKAVIRIEWSSSNYDYMKLDDVTYYPVNTDGNSVFELPVTKMDEAVEVIADTTAMSVPHEITYTICIDSSSMEGQSGNSNMLLIFAVCAAIGVIIGVGIVVYKRRK